MRIGGTCRLTITIRHQIGLLEPKHHVAKMREAAKELANSAGKVTAEKSAMVTGR